MARNGMRVVDGDGHVMEDWDSLLQYLPDPYIKSGRFRGRIFPPLDHLHSANLHELVPGAFRQVDVNGWLEFMDDVGIERAVLYTTGGLAFGKVINGEFALDVSRAWNNWFHDTYLKKSPRFQGLGLIPLQEPEEAVKELRRIVNELGFCGGMIPSTGFKGHLGGKEYWPVYAEANRLGCCLAIHGGAHEGFGMDYLTPYAPIRRSRPSGTSRSSSRATSLMKSTTITASTRSKGSSRTSASPTTISMPFCTATPSACMPSGRRVSAACRVGG